MKLEFGNLEQIKMIKDYQKEAEHKLKSFWVTLDFAGSYTCNVEAEDEDDAIEQAKEDFMLVDAVDWEIEHASAIISKGV